MSRFALFLTVVAAACGGEPPPPPAPPAIQVTVAQFNSLRWLEGSWRGTLNDTMPFFEAYRFVNDSTIEGVKFADSTLTVEKDTGYVTLRKGVVMSGDPDRGWVVSAIDANSAHFEPIGKATNAFTWRREPDGDWTATLKWKDAAGNAVERVYVMRRR